ncbi:ferric reductase [Roseibium aquae]|uniref:Ferric reductase n=1 Tax=Roseibium aquae TaxID=1323746 RepID=A0A916WWE7_9HYPH|nr:ferredoxin reductase family protein [Roseibium aquae]GGB35798.1 ferric reductase [Roseibium aquae]
MGGIALAGLYLAILFTPLGLAGLQDKPARPLWDDLAAGFGMLAFTIILAEFLLSGRFRSVSGHVGLDVTMRFHRLLARTCLLLAILHPFLYSLPFSYPLPYDPTRQLTLAQPGVSLATGVVAWVLLPAFVLVSISKSAVFKTYEGWRLGHGLGAALIAGFTWHHAVFSGRYSQDPVLAAIWTLFLALALASLAFVYLGRPVLQARRPWRVSGITRAAERTWNVVIKPEGHGGLPFKAGQFVWLNIGHSPFSLHENPFSIASAPSPGGAMRFVIKELGDFTSTVGSIPVGTPAYIDGPHGHLTPALRDAPGLALIAGGVGIAPMLGILRDLEARGDSRPVVLIYGNRTADQIVDGDVLLDMSRRNAVDVVHVLAEPGPDWQGDSGVIDEALLARYLGHAEQLQWLYVLCGPPAMLEAVEQILLDRGVPRSNILSERFSYD